MEWMDRFRLWGGWLWVGGGLLLEGIALLAGAPAPGLITWTLVATVVLLALALAVARDSKATRVIGWVTAVFIAADFAGAIADRFGAFGKPGDAGVSWGNWTEFVDYTATMLHTDSTTVASVAGAAATVAELALAALIVTGWQRRWVAKAIAGLFFSYTVFMALSSLRDDVFVYAMPVLIGGALLLSATPHRRLRDSAAQSADCQASAVQTAGY